MYSLVQSQRATAKNFKVYVRILHSNKASSHPSPTIQPYIQHWSLFTKTLQNVNEVNREHSRLAAASSVCDSTKHNGLVTPF